MVTRVNDRSNETSDAIESTSDDIDTVVPRDTSTSAERYIIFLKGGVDDLPQETREKVDELGFNLRAMEDHAIDYELKGSWALADYIALNK